MLAPPHRHKRPRSPSPTFDPDLTSPLDVLLKRRRREERFWTSTSTDDIPGDSSPAYTSYIDRESQVYEGQAESSATASRRSMAGVERRRTRQWERQNAPPGPTSHSSPHHANEYLSPIPSRHAYSQPNAMMSSSPIRNLPPSSSPFRDKSSSQHRPDWMRIETEPDYGHQYDHHLSRDIDVAAEPEPEMDAEEMRREWGEEYATQNSLLHNLHLSRMNANAHSYTPDSTQTLISTPTIASPQIYRQTTYFPDSSPFQPHSEPHVFAPPSDAGYASDNADEEMEMLDDGDNEVKRRYEETNRLLGQLEVVRRMRWGEAES